MTSSDVEFKAGALAYWDTLCSGLVPVKVTEVREPGDGRRCTSGVILAIVTADRGPYKRGEVIKATAAYVVPRKMVHRSGGRLMAGVNHSDGHPVKRYPGSLTIGASCLMAASAIIGWSAGGHQGHGAPVPAQVGPEAQVVYHYGESIPNLPSGMRLDIAMDTWPGTYDQALHECDRMGGEPVTYSWLPDITQMVCEHVDY